MEESYHGLLLLYVGNHTSHGIGLHTVKKLVERYGGIMRIVAGEQEFSVEIIFTIK